MDKMESKMENKETEKERLERVYREAQAFKNKVHKYIEKNDEKEYKDMHPRDMLDKLTAIRNKLEQVTTLKRIELQRKKITIFIWEEFIKELDYEFSKWSYNFNIRLRKQIDLPNLEKEIKQKYKFVYAYWWNTFHFFIDVLSKKTILLHKNKKKYIEESADTLEQLVYGQVEVKNIHPKFLNLVEDLNKKPAKSM